MIKKGVNLMGYEKIQRPLHVKGDVQATSGIDVATEFTQTVQALTSSGTANAYGITTFTSTDQTDNVIVLPEPSTYGQTKIFVCVQAGSSQSYDIIPQTTSVLIATTRGSTERKVVMNTGDKVTMVYTSANRWDVLSNLGTSSSPTS
jgi:hypothetical protein